MPEAPSHVVKGRLGWSGHALVQLTLVRIREFVRESEAVFWAIFFPVLLTAGLGLAFRGGTGDVLKVATSAATLARSMQRDASLAVSVMDEAAARHALAIGRVVLVADELPDGAVRFQYRRHQSRGARGAIAGGCRNSARRRTPGPGARGSTARPGARVALR